MKKLTFIILFISSHIFSQNIVFPTNNITVILENMQGDHSVGNPCGVDNRIVTNVYSDMNMNNYLMHVYNADITVHGSIINEGIIEFKCDDAVLTVIGGSLSIENPNKVEYKVYPNPARYEINIVGLDIKKIIFYNISGQIVKQYTTPMRHNRINISNLSSGMYLINIIDINGNNIVKKIIKK